MIVALGAPRRLPHPRRADGPHAVGHRAGLVILRLRAALLGREDQEVESRADPRLRGGIRQQIARDLLDGEAVEGLVLIKGADHPVPIRPDIVRVVAVVADGVREAHHIQPAESHALAVMRVRHQPVHDLLVGIRRSVFRKRLQLLRRRRQPRQVERHAPDQCPPVGLRRRLQPQLREPFFHEKIHALLPRRDHRLHRRLVGPVLLVNRPLRDPLLENFLLPPRQLLVRLRRRHQFVLVAREKPPHHLALLRLPRHDRRLPGLRRLQRLLADVQPQLRLARLCIRPVAVKASVRENRPHIAVVLDLCRYRRLGGESGRGERGEKAQGVGRAKRHGVRKETIDKPGGGKTSRHFLASPVGRG